MGVKKIIREILMGRMRAFFGRLRKKIFRVLLGRELYLRIYPCFTDSTEEILLEKTASDKEEIEQFYDQQFYADLAARSYRSAKILIPMLQNIVPGIDSVIDLGAGVGSWLKAWSESENAPCATGFDINTVDDKHLYVERKYVNIFDVTKLRFQNINKRFSLAQSLEYAEHVDEEFAESHIKLLTELADFVLFSAAAPGQGGTHHVNEQPPAYWALKFQRFGYVCFDILRHRIWNDDRINWSYRQNIMLYVKKEKVDIFKTRFVPTLEPNLYYHPCVFNMHKK